VLYRGRSISAIVLHFSSLSRHSSHCHDTHTNSKENQTFACTIMSATVVLGSQWGDEGKGKLVDILAYDNQLCCRAQGGNNAGHTIVVNGVTYDFHILPSGLINPRCINLVGSGCVVHIPSFFKELEALEKHGLDTKNRIFISDRAHVVFDLHQLADGLEEVELGEGFIGTDMPRLHSRRMGKC
jgi:adenylosuccinate synthase